jgi:hypothetical protein
MIARETEGQLPSEAEIILVRDRNATLAFRCFLIVIAKFGLPIDPAGVERYDCAMFHRSRRAHEIEG